MAPIKADGARFLKKSPNVQQEDMSLSSMVKTPALFAKANVQVNERVIRSTQYELQMSDSSEGENEPPKPDVKVAPIEVEHVYLWQLSSTI